ncbi:MAG: hypothetical protein BGO98_17765 [Myxococcales bacterium 68-20]|nr:MAG: hypothetical protein BGO98_17765 [Myxococcales bacterium 68-20]
MVRRAIPCGRCRLVRTEREWSELPVHTQLTGEEVSGVVSRWPDHLVVVVRACSCGAPIARLAPAPLG